MSDHPSAPAPEEALHLFEGYGVEIEYMIVGRDSLDVLPVSDKLLHAVAGEYEPEVELGRLAWSNELVLHVLEMKTNGPAPSLGSLGTLFQESVARANELLAPLGGRLLPGACHPWMNPEREMHLWPHEYNPVYESFNRIFNCRGHGWANLQSTHLNLPFSGDDEFGRLHAAVRLLLPLIPALAASSPFLEGAATGKLDSRLAVYRTHVARVPALIGDVVPEPVYKKSEYERRIFQRIYEDLEPYDPEGILRHEWSNARGAIARFDRSAIEIRLVDVQECPQADIAIAAALSAVAQALVAERWRPYEEQRAWPNQVLGGLLERTTITAEETLISNPLLLETFGWGGAPRCTAGELWQHLLEDLDGTEFAVAKHERLVLDAIGHRGTLARRLLRAAGESPGREKLREVYEELAAALAQGRLFGV